MLDSQWVAPDLWPRKAPKVLSDRVKAWRLASIPGRSPMLYALALCYFQIMSCYKQMKSWVQSLESVQPTRPVGHFQIPGAEEILAQQSPFTSTPVHDPSEPAMAAEGGKTTRTVTCLSSSRCCGFYWGLTDFCKSYSLLKGHCSLTAGLL